MRIFPSEFFFEKFAQQNSQAKLFYSNPLFTVAMAKPELEKLHPAERLKRLKELEQKKKQEIEEAQQQIRESERELSEERKWKEKVPIPEIAKEDLEGLSEEGKALLKAHRGLPEKKPGGSSGDTVETAEESVEEAARGNERGEGKTREEREEQRRGRASRRGKASVLEETVAQERMARPAANVEYGAALPPGRPLDVDYTLRLSQRPVENLYQEITGLRQEAEEKGYLSRADVRRVEYLTGAVEEKFRAADEGRYTFSQETARAASLTQQIGAELRSMYKRGIEAPQKDWYKGQ